MALAPNLSTGSHLAPCTGPQAGLPATQPAPRSARPPSTSARRGLPRASSLAATISTHSRRGSNASRSPRASRRHPHPYAPPPGPARISMRHDTADTMSVAAPGQLVSSSPASPDLSLVQTQTCTRCLEDAAEDRYCQPVHSRADGPHSSDLLTPDRVGDLAEGPAALSAPRVCSGGGVDGPPWAAAAAVATPYMRYANDMHSIVMAKDPDLTPGMCAQLLALFWAGLDDDAKLQWHQPETNMRSQL